MNYNQFITEFVNRSQYYPKKNKIVTGTNGLYGEKESVYRTLAHWAVLIQDADLPNDKIVEFVELFIRHYEEHDLHVGPFKARESSEKDSSNGLIGTAWNVEGMIATYKLTNKIGLDKSFDINLTLKSMIDKLYSHYTYCEVQGNWPNIVEPNGNILGIDRTFNHQLWFAASKISASSVFCPNEDFDSMDAEHFVKTLCRKLKRNHRGTIYHTLGTYPHYHKTLLKRLILSTYRRDMVKKEYGYHGFNLLALVRMFDFNEVFFSKLIREQLIVINKEHFIEAQENNEYGSSYNPVGLELAAALSKLNHNDDRILFWLNYHFSRYFNSSEFEFHSSNDIATLNSRVYEMVYIDERTKSLLNYSTTSNVWSFEKSD